MTPQLNSEKSCGPQLLDDDQPSRSWGLEKLGQFIQEKHRRIVEGERELAPAYWLLGQALNLARQEFGRGQWGKYLAELGIHKTRASKARAIFQNFQSQNEVVGYSVEDAYEQRNLRKERSSRTAKRASKGKSSLLKAFLEKAPGEAKELLAQAGKIRPSDARKLLASLDAAIQNLQRLRTLLESKAGSEAKVCRSKTAN